MIYYVILLIFLLWGFVVGSRFKFVQSLKYIGLWLGIALVFVILYSYRYEFSSLKNRVLGEISPMSARQDGRGRIVINLSRDGHFYVNTKVNGRSIRFLVDTGASDVALSLQDAKIAGVDVRSLNFNRPYSTANGVIMGASTRLSEISLGGIKFYDVEASVNGAKLGVSLLGMSFLKRFSRYEVYRGKLILER